MMSSKILKSFIKVVFYVFQLYVYFLQKKLGSIGWNNISNLSIKLFFKLLRSLLWRLKIFLIFGWLGKGKQKIKIVIAEIKVWGMETKWQRLGDIARGTETVWRGLEVILQIWRLWGHFCRAYGASAPLHRCSCDEISKKKHSFLLSRNLLTSSIRSFIE